MIVAIDGPAGSGKSSTARAVARRLGFHHLDSGALYRAATWAALQHGVPEREWDELDGATLDRFELRAAFVGDAVRVWCGEREITREIRAPDVTAHVSGVAAIAAVRDWVNARLRAIAASTDVVTEGRDIGTVVFPDADLKVFLVADPEARARRRLREHGVDSPTPAELRAEIGRLATRDRLDSERAVAPLRRPRDAVVVDTTRLGFEEQVERIVRLAREKAS